jgi:hypothetical protein
VVLPTRTVKSFNGPKGSKSDTKVRGLARLHGPRPG